MGEYEPNDSRNVTGTGSSPDGRWTNAEGKPPKGVPEPEFPMRGRNRDALPPEARNREQDDEDAQAQTIAEEGLDGDAERLGDSEKVPTGRDDDDVPDLVDHMRQMDRSGRIDYSAYRGERNDDDEEDSLGPSAKE